MYLSLDKGHYLDRVKIIKHLTSDERGLQNNKTNCLLNIHCFPLLSFIEYSKMCNIHTPRYLP